MKTLITFQDEGKRKERDLDLDLLINVRTAVEEICVAFGIVQDWTYGLRYQDCWIHDQTLIKEIPFKSQTRTLELRTKTSDYFEVQPGIYAPVPEPKSPNKETRKDHRHFNFKFRATPTTTTTTTDDRLISKLSRSCIYFSTLFFTSDSKILLNTGSGFLPTVLVLENDIKAFCDLNTESKDFTWMIKLMLDRASDFEVRRQEQREQQQRQQQQGLNSKKSLEDQGESSTTTTTNSSSTRVSSSSDVGGGGLLSSHSPLSSIASSTHPSPSLQQQQYQQQYHQRQLSNLSTISPSGSSRYFASCHSTDPDPLRTSFVNAVESLYRELCGPNNNNSNHNNKSHSSPGGVVTGGNSSCDFGILYNKIIDLPFSGSKLILSINYISNQERGGDSGQSLFCTDLIQSGLFKWKSIDPHLHASFLNLKKEEIWSSLPTYYDTTLLQSNRGSRSGSGSVGDGGGPSSGLYLGLFYLESNLSGLSILVPRQRCNFLPIIKIRQQSTLSDQEWEWIQSTQTMDSSKLAKSCVELKQDPMYDLKVEFARSLAVLSASTNIRWDSEDLFIKDTVVVKMGQKRSEKFSGMSKDLQSKTRMTTGTGLIGGGGGQDGGGDCVDGSSETTTTNNTTKEDSFEEIRIIMFVKPTRHASQPREKFNTQLYEMIPFSVFDAMHHSCFNSAVYHPLRQSLKELSDEIEAIKLEQTMVGLAIREDHFGGTGGGGGERRGSISNGNGTGYHPKQHTRGSSMTTSLFEVLKKAVPSSPANNNNNNIGINPNNINNSSTSGSNGLAFLSMNHFHNNNNNNPSSHNPSRRESQVLETPPISADATSDPSAPARFADFLDSFDSPPIGPTSSPSMSPSSAMSTPPPSYNNSTVSLGSPRLLPLANGKNINNNATSSPLSTSSIYTNTPTTTGNRDVNQLRRKMKALNDQWRALSWTIQLNEWDHARTSDHQRIRCSSLPTVMAASPPATASVQPGPQQQLPPLPMTLHIPVQQQDKNQDNTETIIPLAPEIVVARPTPTTPLASSPLSLAMSMALKTGVKDHSVTSSTCPSPSSSLPPSRSLTPMSAYVETYVEDGRDSP